MRSKTRRKMSDVEKLPLSVYCTMRPEKIGSKSEGTIESRAR